MKRRYLIGYPLWNCLDMVPWILDGIQKNIDPSRAGLAFLFSNTPHEVVESFEQNRHKISAFSCATLSTNRDLWEGENHNFLMEFFMMTSCDALIVMQDDHQFQSGRLIDDLDRVFDEYGERIGLIGGRDGYSWNWTEMVGSRFSTSAHLTRKLEHGETAERPMLNTGPFVYTRDVIEKIGLNDPAMPIFGFEDYCLRCIQDGRVNVVMGMDLKHEKFGRVRETKAFGAVVSNDLARLREKWKPILGHDVHG